MHSKFTENRVVEPKYAHDVLYKFQRANASEIRKGLLSLSLFRIALLNKRNRIYYRLGHFIMPIMMKNL